MFLIFILFINSYLVIQPENMNSKFFNRTLLYYFAAKLLQFSLILLTLWPGSLFSYARYNIRGFFGERAPGMGGAYAAISDDPSGAIYNPAGLAFSYYKHMSSSAVNYHEANKKYTKVNGWNKSYHRQSNELSPGFIGSIYNLYDYTFGMSIINRQTEKYDQSDSINRFFNIPQVSSLQAQYMENNSNYTFGPSLSTKLSERFSIGFSLFGFMESNRISTRTFVKFRDFSYINTDEELTKSTNGILPILGFQYMVTDKLSLGLTLQRPFSLNGNVTIDEAEISSDSSSANLINSLQITETQTEGVLGIPMSNEYNQQLFVFGNAGASEQVAEPMEIRFGMAFFFSPKFTAAFDIIHTTSYRKKHDHYLFEPNVRFLIIQSREFLELRQIATTNYAFGWEYYLSENFVIRMGTFTNLSNVKKMNWWQESIKYAIKARAQDYISVDEPQNGIVLYTPEILQAEPREENVNMHGYSLGFGWETTGSSLALNLVQESGRGLASLGDGDLPPVVLKSINYSVYLSATLLD